jgi:hypothetical protein
MRPKLFLRSAAVVTLLLGVGHLMGRPWTPTNDPRSQAVVDAMTSHPMHVMGFQRTFMDFYSGFGLIIGANLLAQAVLLWMVADLVTPAPTQARRIAAVFFVMNVAATVLAGLYLFTAPLVLSGLVTLCLAAAVATPFRR